MEKDNSNEMENFEKYINYKKELIIPKLKSKIESGIIEKFKGIILNKEESQSKNLKNFLLYYEEITIDRKEIKFKEFRAKYSLRGIHSDYIYNLEKENHDNKIINLIEKENLSNAYFHYFHQKKVNNSSTPKNLGSFFTKLVHTVHPEKYTALDNPTKKYFLLNDESYFVSLLIVSEAYKEYISKNEWILKQTREDLEKIFFKKFQHHFKIKSYSDIKILDLIFWQTANQK